MIERISKIIENEDISVRAFEQKIKASNGLIRKAIANNTDIQSRWISNIVENYPRYNLEWLLTGKGEMLKPEEKTRGSVGVVPHTPQKTPESAPYDIKAFTDLIAGFTGQIGNLHEQLGAQANENRHLYESNMKLSAQVESLNNTIENLKKENDGLKTQIRELKKEGKPYEMPVSPLSLVAESIPAPIVKKTGKNPQITPTEPLPTRLSTPKNL